MLIKVNQMRILIISRNPMGLMQSPLNIGFLQGRVATRPYPFPPVSWNS